MPKFVTWDAVIRARDFMEQRWKAVVGLSCTAILIEFVYFANQIALWAKMGVTEWAYWTGAIGTIGALIGTILLATAETRRRNQEAYDRAKVAGAAAVFNVLRTIQPLNKMLKAVNGDEMMSDRETTYRKYEKTLKNLPRWPGINIQDLIPLPNHVAANLAVAGTIIDDMIKNMPIFQDTKTTYEVLGRRRAFLINQLESVIKSLDIALKECQKCIAEIQ